ncbi:MAG TPA: Arc family DNA-binding protein [Actinomycetes bacterium]
MKQRLRERAATHGRSMEAEIREILSEAVREPGEEQSPATGLLARFGELGGVDLELPPRSTAARPADLTR